MVGMALSHRQDAYAMMCTAAPDVKEIPWSWM
jgi:hypothetical protein